MTLARRGNVLNELPMLFDDFFKKDLYHFGLDNFSEKNSTLPAVNIKENPENFEVEVAAPGMSKEDFKLELDENVLTISAEKSAERSDTTTNNYSCREFNYQGFQRKFNLEKNVVDAEKITARYENGLLKLSIPKKEEVKPQPGKTIRIS